MNAPHESSSWQAFFNLGGLAGALSLIWQVYNSLHERLRRPRLKILDIDRPRNIFEFRTGDGAEIRFVTVHVKNEGRRYANRCVARARLRTLGGHQREVPLHWADTPVIYRTTGQSHVDIVPGGYWRLDVAFAKPTGPSAFLASESALYGNFYGDAEIPPGQHEIEVKVTFEDGNTAVRILKVNSSGQWNELDASFES